MRVRDVAAGVISTTFTNNQLTAPKALAVAPNGDVYVAMGSGSIQIAETAGLVRKISGNAISTVAGLLIITDPYGDCGLAVNATMDSPQGIAVDANGDVYVSETADNVIRMITPAGVIETVAGSRDTTEGFSGDGGPATSALLSQPTGLALAANGDLIFADAGNNRIRKITKSGTISTIAGDGFPGFDGDGGPALSAEFRGMRGVAVDSAGDIFVADTLNNRVREISGGTVSTVAGSGTFGFSGDGAAATDAELAAPGRRPPRRGRKKICTSPTPTTIVCVVVAGLPSAVVLPASGPTHNDCNFFQRNPKSMLGHRRSQWDTGDPVDTASGNFVQQETDLTAASGAYGMDWVRTYNSRSDATVYSVRAGRHRSPTRSSTTATGRPPIPRLMVARRTSPATAAVASSGPTTSRPNLTQNGDGTWILTWFDGEIWTFDTSGNLTTKTNWDGQTATATRERRRHPAVDREARRARR